MNTKRTLAAFLAASLVMSVPAMAVGNDWTPTAGLTVEEGNDVKNPIIVYQIPTELGFAVDAFQQADATKSQVYSPDLQLINKSNVGIKVVVKPKLVPKDATVVVKTAPADVNKSDTSITEKQIYMEAVAAKTLAVPTTETAGTTNATVVALTGLPADGITVTSIANATGGKGSFAVVVPAGAASVSTTGNIDLMVFGQKIKSGNLSGALTSGTDIGALFVGKTVTIDGVEFAATASTGTITFTTTGNLTAKLPSLDAATPKAFLVSSSTDGTFTMETPTYEEYVVTTGSPQKGKAQLGADPASLTFALKGAEYVLPYTGAPSKTLFSKLARTTDKLEGATTFRFMGTVNPAANWAKDDVKVNVTFDVSGLSSSMYDDLTKAAGKPADGVNLVGATNAKPAAPANSDPTIANATYTKGDANLTLTVTDGTGTGKITSVKTVYNPQNAYAITAFTGTTTIVITDAAILPVLVSGNTIEVTFVTEGGTEKTVSSTITVATV